MMLSFTSRLICILIVLVSCGDAAQKPELPLPRNQVRAILTDLYLANAAVELHPSAKKDSLQEIFLTEICKIHHIKPETIAQIQKVLQEDLKLNADIQKEVLDSVNLIPLKRMSRF